MGVFITSLFGWMPLGLQLVCLGIVAIFFIGTALHLVKFVLDLIPFL